MVGSQRRERNRSDRVAAIIYALGLAVILAALLGNFQYYIRYGLSAIGYPQELEYGEGLVWQQMVDLANGRMYTNIHDYPYVNYNFTPLYHAVAYIAATLLGDPLSAGRAVSMVSALLLSGLVGLAVVQASGRSYSSTARLTGAVIAALLIFRFQPVYFWSVLMRVDLLAIMLSVLGFNLFLGSLKRPWLLFPCGLAFVFAFFAKQNTIAAAAACTAVSLMIRPALAWQAIVLSVALGGVALVVLTFVTDGEFLLHVFLYNFNPLELTWLFSLYDRLFSKHWYLASLVVISAGFLTWQLATTWRSPSSESWRPNLSQCPEALATLTLLMYFLVVTATSAGAAKVGAWTNYFIEWVVVWAMILGIVTVRISARFIFPLDWARARVRGFVLAGVAGLIVIQTFLAPIRGITAPSFADGEAARQIVEEIQATPGPVLSTDMVLLLKAGKSVPLEPYMMATLSRQGLWDQSGLIEKLRGQFFDLVIVRTRAADGSRTPERFTPEIKGAVLRAYPTVEQIGSFLIYRPGKGEGQTGGYLEPDHFAPTN